MYKSAVDNKSETVHNTRFQEHAYKRHGCAGVDNVNVSVSVCV